MISSSIIDFLLNKYSLIAGGSLIALIYAYFKGRSAANDNNDLQKLEDERKLNSRLRSAEAKNAFLEKKGEATNDKINAADTIDSLLGLFDEIESSKGSGSDADKKP